MGNLSETIVLVRAQSYRSWLTTFGDPQSKLSQIWALSEVGVFRLRKVHCHNIVPKEASRVAPGRQKCRALEHAVFSLERMMATPSLLRIGSGSVFAPTAAPVGTQGVWL
jgi:hypothetical protein